MNWMTQSFNQRDHKPKRQRLRSTMPPAEAILWSQLNGRKLLGCKFRRQYGIDSYTVDFYSAEIKLAIELDGETHSLLGRKEYDQRRDAVIQSYGIRILRILNNDVYENLDGVWDAIVREAKKRMAELGPEVIRGRRGQRGKRATETGDAPPPAPPC
jgi:very-short-patch-repair endonuclease